jgi:hypothetical protein
MVGEAGILRACETVQMGIDYGRSFLGCDERDDSARHCQRSYGSDLNKLTSRGIGQALSLLVDVSTELELAPAFEDPCHLVFTDSIR